MKSRLQRGSQNFPELTITGKQILREFRGRLKPRSVLAAVALSVIFQSLLGLFVSQVMVNLVTPQEKWLRVCQTLTWCIPYLLFIIGSYYLVSDFTQEEKRGTLNFIRLSPRPAHEILLGKLLGVPILPYVMVAAAIPLHLVSAVLGGVPLIMLMSYYLVLIVAVVFVYCLAMLAGLTGSARPLMLGQQAPTAIAFAGLALFFLAPGFMFWNQFLTWYAVPGRELLFGNLYSEPSMEWLYLPISQNALIAHGFTLVNLGISIVLLWQVLKRLFHNPRTTLLSKRLSYIVVAYANGLTWGFFQTSQLDADDRLAALIVLYALNASLFAILCFGLNPQRQMLLDWSRYRSRQQDLLRSLIWDDKSPAVVAIAINFLIVASLIVPWTFIILNQAMVDVPELSFVGVFLAVISVGLCFLTYATLVQIIFSTRVHNPYIWGVGVVMVVIVVPLILMGIFRLSPEGSPAVMTLWTFLGYPFWDYSEPNIMGYMGLGLVLQLGLLATLLYQLNHHLKKLAHH